MHRGLPSPRFSRRKGRSRRSPRRRQRRGSGGKRGEGRGGRSRDETRATKLQSVSACHMRPVCRGHGPEFVRTHRRVLSPARGARCARANGEGSRSIPWRRRRDRHSSDHLGNNARGVIICNLWFRFSLLTTHWAFCIFIILLFVAKIDHNKSVGSLYGTPAQC